MFDSKFLRSYLLPGLVFQSVLIGGGYGTGRELVEFFLSYGPLDGLLAMFVSTAIWCVVCAITYELARISKAYDYRTFSRVLLGRAWGLYEACYLALTLLALAVIAASAGSILNETFAIPYYTGVIGMMLCIGFLVFKGSTAVEKFLSMWSMVLYGVYFILCVWSLTRYGGQILSKLLSAGIGFGWFQGGIRYAAYNILPLPALLFSARYIQTRRQAMAAGALAGPIGIVPGLFFYLAMVSQYPAVLSQTVPANYILETLGSDVFQYTFQIVLLGTLTETGTGLIHGINERVAGVFAEKNAAMPSFLRTGVALASLICASMVARFGLIDLIAKGYGTATWGGLLVFVIPVLILGPGKIRRSEGGR